MFLFPSMLNSFLIMLGNIVRVSMNKKYSSRVFIVCRLFSNWSRFKILLSKSKSFFAILYFSLSYSYSKFTFYFLFFSFCLSKKALTNGYKILHLSITETFLRISLTRSSVWSLARLFESLSSFKIFRISLSNLFLRDILLSCPSCPC